MVLSWCLFGVSETLMTHIFGPSKLANGIFPKQKKSSAAHMYVFLWGGGGVSFLMSNYHPKNKGVSRLKMVSSTCFFWRLRGTYIDQNRWVMFKFTVHDALPPVDTTPVFHRHGAHQKQRPHRFIDGSRWFANAQVTDKIQSRYSNNKHHPSRKRFIVVYICFPNTHFFFAGVQFSTAPSRICPHPDPDKLPSKSQVCVS